MKKLFSILFTFMMAFILTACQTTKVEETSKQDKKTQELHAEETLIVYFSMPETTKTDDMTVEEANSTVFIDGEVMGNTQYFANIIQEQTKGTLFRIEPVQPYPVNHETLVEQASKEQEENARPAIKNKIDNFEQYDTVFIGYPNWWGDMPMILYTFFDTYDFSNKTIIPFNTHGGSGFSNTVDSIKQLEPNATILDQGLSISRNDIENAKTDIIEWIATITSEN